jgi:hypothetical protein
MRIIGKNQTSSSIGINMNIKMCKKYKLIYTCNIWTQLKIIYIILYLHTHSQHLHLLEI